MNQQRSLQPALIATNQLLLPTNNGRYLLVPSSSSCQLLVGPSSTPCSIKLVGATRCSRNGGQFGNNSNHKSAILEANPLLVCNSIYQGPKKQPTGRQDRCTCCFLGALYNDNANWHCKPGTSRAHFRALMASVLCVDDHLSAQFSH